MRWSLRRWTSCVWVTLSLCTCQLLFVAFVPWDAWHCSQTALRQRVNAHPTTPPRTDSLLSGLLVGNQSSLPPAETDERHRLTTALPLDLPTLGAEKDQARGSSSPAAGHGSGGPPDLQGILANLSLPWTPNATRKTVLRKMLNSALPAADYAVLTKKNVVLGQNMTFALNKRLSQPMKMDLFNLLPYKSPLSGLSTCSVVGNSGILANSNCGRAIDQNDFVFRCNTPPIKKYGQHAGFKSSLTSINPFGVIGARYKNLGSAPHRNRFVRDMQAYAGLLVPAYGPNVSAFKISLAALRLLKQRGSSTQALVTNPSHFRAIQSKWEEMGLKGRITTGFYLVSVAMAACESVELYGFWPFDEGLEHKPVTYHYYDSMRRSKGVHNFDWEFDVLHKLHMGGALRMHVGPCL